MFLDDVEDYVNEINAIYEIKESNFSVKFLFIPVQGWKIIVLENNVVNNQASLNINDLIFGKFVDKESAKEICDWLRNYNNT